MSAVLPERVWELADAATALADEIEQGDDCGDTITNQLADALVRVAVLALNYAPRSPSSASAAQASPGPAQEPATRQRPSGESLGGDGD